MSFSIYYSVTTGDRSDPEVAAWLEWRSKNKASKPILTSVNRPPSSFTSLAAGVNRTQVQQAPKPVQQQQISQQALVKEQKINLYIIPIYNVYDFLV